MLILTIKKSIKRAIPAYNAKARTAGISDNAPKKKHVASDDDDNNFPPDTAQSNSPSESSSIDTDPTIHPSSPASSVSHSPSTTNSSPVSPEPQPAKITGMAPSPPSISSSISSSPPSPRHLNIVRRQLDYNANQKEAYDESITISDGNLEGDQ